MGDLLNIKSASHLWSEILKLFEDQVLVTSTLVQAGGIAFSLFLAVVIARMVRTRWQSALSGVGIIARNKQLCSVLSDLLLPVLWLILQGLILFAAQYYKYPAQLASISCNLLIAWIVIRITSIFVLNASLARVIATAAWSIAALNIIGWLDPAAALLDSVAFNLGEMRVSLLTFFKGLLSLGILLWIAFATSNVLDRHLRSMTGITPSLQVLFSKLIKVTLVTFAILIGISSVGIDITALAVFSGAIGVGIGFGLQKIVSNLISGVILLIDRSIKPGDVIEVAETYGWINKLSARHVSVITRDGKEHLIPNEDLITQKVVNWSYSSKSVRLRIPVGISYTSDPYKAIELLKEVALEIDRVIPYPKPNALLRSFGDSSIDLELRVWIEDPANGVANVTSIILLAVWDKFRSHGIEFPYPQRDVHLNMSEPLLKALKTQ